MTINLDNLSKHIDHRGEQAEIVDLLRIRMQMLEEDDRILLETYIENNSSFRKLGKLTGSDPRKIARKIKKQIKNLLANQYISIKRQQKQFSQTELVIAYDHYLLGLGYRKIAAKRNLKDSRVRTTLKKLQMWLQKQMRQNRDI